MHNLTADAIARATRLDLSTLTDRHRLAVECCAGAKPIRSAKGQPYKIERGRRTFPHATINALTLIGVMSIRVMPRGIRIAKLTPIGEALAAAFISIRTAGR